jgi:Peptidase M50B-like
VASFFETQVPIWTSAIFFIAFWLWLRALNRFVRLWAFLNLPATFLHELAHAFVGILSGARPTRMSLWPKRVGSTSWRLGSVGFTRLRWWNGGAVTLAPLLWLILLSLFVRDLPSLGASLSLQASIVIGISSVWLCHAVMPSRTDWHQALEYWPSALLFLAGWGYILQWLIIK